MISHRFYLAESMSYDGYIGQKTIVSEVKYCTNDSTDGIFFEDYIQQMTGNGQFKGDGKKLFSWLNKNARQNQKYFLSFNEAEDWANKINTEVPLEKISKVIYTAGQKVTWFEGHDLLTDAKFVSQDGENITIDIVGYYGDEDKDITRLTVPYYDIV